MGLLCGLFFRSGNFGLFVQHPIDWIATTISPTSRTPGEAEIHRAISRAETLHSKLRSACVSARELAQLILAGHPNSVIATKLGITPGPAKNHRHNIYNKLDITTEREMFLQYVESISVT